MFVLYWLCSDQSTSGNMIVPSSTQSLPDLIRPFTINLNEPSSSNCPCENGLERVNSEMCSDRPTSPSSTKFFFNVLNRRARNTSLFTLISLVVADMGYYL